MSFKRIYKRYLAMKWVTISVHRVHFNSPRGLRDVPYTVLRMLKLFARNSYNDPQLRTLAERVTEELARRLKI